MKVRTLRTVFLLPAIAAGLAGLAAISVPAQAAPSGSLPRPASDQPSVRGTEAPVSRSVVDGLTGRAAQASAGEAGTRFKALTLARARRPAASQGSTPPPADWLHSDWGVFLPNDNGKGLQVTQSVVPTAGPSRGNEFIYAPTAVPPGPACMEIVTAYGPDGPAVWAWDWCGGRSGVAKSVPIDASFLATYTATVNGRPAYTLDQHLTDAATNTWTSYLYNYTTHLWDVFFVSGGTSDLAALGFTYGWNMFEVYSNLEDSTGSGYYCTDFAGQGIESTGAKLLSGGSWVAASTANSFPSSDPPPDGQLNCPGLDFTLTHPNDAWLAEIGTTSTQPPACTASYRTVSSWGGGFQGEVTVTAGPAAINSWAVTLTWPSGQTVTQVWNGTASGSRVSNVSHNGNLAVGASTTFGFLADGSAGTPTLSCARS